MTEEDVRWLMSRVHPYASNAELIEIAKELASALLREIGERETATGANRGTPEGDRGTTESDE